MIKLKSVCVDGSGKFGYIIEVKVGNLYANIMKLDGTSIDLELANSLVREFAKKEIIDLDEYNLGFSSTYEVDPRNTFVMNAFDENEIIPLEVVIVDK